MSLQLLGKPASPPVVANGEKVEALVQKASLEKNPPPGFDVTRLVEIAQAKK